MHITVEVSPQQATANVISPVLVVNAQVAGSMQHNALLGKQGGVTDEYYHLSAAELANFNIMVGGGDTALHYHSADRARANHTGTQLLATISDAGTMAAEDADNYVEIAGDTMTGALQINIPSPSVVGLTVKGAAVQSANLQEWQNSGGINRVEIDEEGRIGIRTAPGDTMLNLLGDFIVRESIVLGNTTNNIPDFSSVDSTTSGVITHFSVGTGGLALTGFTEDTVAPISPILLSGLHGSTTPPTAAIIIRGGKHDGATSVQALASSDEIVQFRNWTTGVATILGNGDTGIGELSPGARLHVKGDVAANEVLIVQGAAAQSANLQEWQDSSSNLFFSFTSSANPAFKLYRGGILRGTIDSTSNSLSLLSASNTVIIRSTDLLLGVGADGNIRSGDEFTLLFNSGDDYTSSDSLQLIMHQRPSINQSGTAGYRSVAINPTIVSNGSGEKNILWVGHTNVPKFTVEQEGATSILLNDATSVGLAVKGAAAQSANLQEWQDSSGTIGLAIAANTRDFILDTTTGTKIGTATSQKLGLWNVTPVVQPSGTGETVGFVAGSGTGVNDDSTFTGNIGATAYNLNDVVKALKQIGVLAA